jgi:SNF2 family DNA or RNA helicase
MMLKHLRKSLYARLLECSEAMDNLFILVSELMSTVPPTNKVEWNDSKTMMITYYLITSFFNKASQSSKDSSEAITKLEREVIRLQNQIKLFQSNDFIKEKTADPCIICWADYDDSSAIAVTNCRHIFCGACFQSMGTNKSTFPCPECRADIVCKNTKITTMAQIKESDKPPEPVVQQIVQVPVDGDNWKADCISKYGTKMSVLIDYLRTIFAEEGKTNRAIIFSQYDNMLKLIGKTLTEYKISNVYCKGNVHVINKNIDKFKRDNSIRVIMLSSEHSNSGSNLTEASHIILVDVLNMNAAQTKDVECQAIGRAVRLGQQKPVKVVRLITKNTVEEEYYNKNKYDITSIQ